MDGADRQLIAGRCSCDNASTVAEHRGGQKPCRARVSDGGRGRPSSLRAAAVAFIGCLQGCAESHCPKRASGGALGNLLHHRTAGSARYNGRCILCSVGHWRPHGNYRLAAWVSRLGGLTGPCGGMISRMPMPRIALGRTCRGRACFRHPAPSPGQQTASLGCSMQVACR
jgi:hypothetical protein